MSDHDRDENNEWKTPLMVLTGVMISVCVASGITMWFILG
jgi:hypothetical protein